MSETHKRFKALEKLKNVTIPVQALLLEFRNQMLVFFLDEAGPNILVSAYRNPEEMFAFELDTGGNIQATSTDEPFNLAESEALLGVILKEEFNVTGHLRQTLRALFDQIEDGTNGNLPWSKLGVLA